MAHASDPKFILLSGAVERIEACDLETAGEMLQKLRDSGLDPRQNPGDMQYLLFQEALAKFVEQMNQGGVCSVEFGSAKISDGLRSKCDEKLRAHKQVPFFRVQPGSGGSDLYHRFVNAWRNFSERCRIIDELDEGTEHEKNSLKVHFLAHEIHEALAGDVVREETRVA